MNDEPTDLPTVPNLLLCPFCGTEPEWSPKTNSVAHPPNYWPEHVQCKNCHILFREDKVPGNPVENWNRRSFTTVASTDHYEAVLTLSREALQQLLDEQNGPPLCNREAQWNWATHLVRRAISEINKVLTQ